MYIYNVYVYYLRARVRVYVVQSNGGGENISLRPVDSLSPYIYILYSGPLLTYAIYSPTADSENTYTYIIQYTYIYIPAWLAFA